MVLIWPGSGARPAPLPLAAGLAQEDQDHLALFTAAHGEIDASLQNPPASPPAPYAGNSTAGREYFRIRELAPDSDEDGILDWHEFTLGSSPASADSDEDGVEDPWDDIATTLIVSEYQADNGATIADEDGDFEDWIEILNPTTSPISLDGWHLTDKPGGEAGDVPNLAKWPFPNGVTLRPGATLLVWASNKTAMSRGNRCIRISSSAARMTAPIWSIALAPLWTATAGSPSR